MISLAMTTSTKSQYCSWMKTTTTTTTTTATKSLLAWLALTSCSSARSFSSSAFFAVRPLSAAVTSSSPTTPVRSPHSLSSASFLLTSRGGTTTTTTTTTQRWSTTTTTTETTDESTTTTTAAAAAAAKSTDNNYMMSTMTPAEKLQALRNRMKELNLDVWIVPTDDPHLSEYVPDAYKRREFLTHFKGSAGTAVVTQKEALLWTDSRYWNEAGLQLDAEQWTLQKAGLPDTPTIPKWLGELAAKQFAETKESLRVGIDPYVHAASFAKELETAFEEAAQEAGLDDDDDDNDDGKGSTKIGVLEASVKDNLVDAIWGESRPAIPTSPYRVHPLEYAGVSVADKITKIRAEMETKKATMTVFCTLDDVAYLFNLRCKGDIDTCPVGIAYAAVGLEEVNLYCDSAKVQAADVQKHLKEAGVTIKPYDAIVPEIAKHCETKGNKVWLDTSRANLALANVIPKKALVDSQNAVTPMKACKNAAELEGMRQAHIVDGVAMAKFMAWLEQTIVVEGKSVSEVQIDEKLTACRAEQPGFMEVSFPTIAGVGSNAAIIHYRAQPNTDLLKYLDTETPILIDSGGQYTYGTTDVTRTWHLGTPTPEFVDAYTRVLKGNIGLDVMIFPENTPGFVLDVYARRWLWDAGKDYGHGTGHGVGAALNVHEGPMSISPRFANKEVLKPGMVVSNEPGYYEDGNFGVRIENLLEIKYVNPEDYEEKKDEEAPQNGQKKFLKFAKLTMIPIQKNLINVDLMTGDELDWLDSYHATVFEKVSPLLEPDSPAMAWLKKSCEKIDRQSR